MHYALRWLLLILAVLTPFLALIEWMIGEKGAKSVKNRLADWYVFIEEGDWSTLVVFGASSVDRFLQCVFGAPIVSARYVSLGILMSVCYSAIALSAVYGSGFWYWILHPLAAWPAWVKFFHTAAAGNLAFVLYWLLGINAIVDVTSLALSRLLLRRLLVRCTPHKTWKFSVVLVAIAYIGVGFSLFATLGVPACLLSLHMGTLGSPVVIVRSAFVVLFGWPWFFITIARAYGAASAAFGFLFFLTACLSTVLLAMAVTSAGILYLSRPISHKPFAFIVERLAGSRKGLLTVASTVLTSLTAIGTAFDRLL
jgi:hypothetical protein